ncbi:glycoside hydrolase family 20 protein [Dysgonomonas massiliensis]|uniref:glycoside hydrolase family 20 protein n=1 Tax=Dysgonomonas massiliensis TaxID=2040292 RepID=UPI000C75D8C9
MKLKHITVLVCCIIILFTSCKESKMAEANYDIVPLPQSIEIQDETVFSLNENTKIVYTSGDEGLERTAQFLAEYIKQNTGLKISITDQAAATNNIILKIGLSSSNSEAYKIDVTSEGIYIEGASHAGVFYGVQTIRKSIPADNDVSMVNFKGATINDYPRFSYRGMHLDVARHMFSVDSIKIYIDMLALHNINRFHWHLTDDQGWRMEIKKYPELTKIGSMREQTVIGKNSGEYDGQPYGGYYTQEEIKDVVKYAQDRFITVIPEVDLPGHMLAALTTYPNLGCTGGPYKVAQTWGIFDDVLCAGNEDIYPFLEDIFNEVIDLFPSEYIHVGGDECPKTQWEKCPKCQAKINELGLKADAKHTKEQRLQSYVIQRIEKYINSKGRKVIGWDEILEGGIAPNATIMSWQGVEGGTAAAKQGHDAIMTPTTFLYFDYYQSVDLKGELFGIGGYVPVETVYNYEPVPAELTEEQKKHIIGTQANVWTEYMKNFYHVQYMVLPRMGALSEIQWAIPEKKDYAKFLPRLANLTKLYKHYGYNYATHIFNIKDKVEIDNEKKQVKLTLSTFDNAAIYYTLDGSEPTENSSMYTDVLIIDKDAILKAISIRDGVKSKIYERELNINKATFRPITLENKPWGRYTYAGAPTLVDGQKGGDVYSSGGWIGFQQDLVATVDLGEITDFSSVVIGTFIDVASWIFNPSEFTVEISNDNASFTKVFSQEYAPVDESHKIGPEYLNAKFDKVEARYVKVTAKYLRSQPSWAGGAGKAASLFVDEIQIY